jgi:hypothetical protein
MKVGPDSGMGMGCAPEQYPHVPLVSQANCMWRLHREYSGPVEPMWRRGTFCRRGDAGRDMAKLISETREQVHVQRDSTRILSGAIENMYPFLASSRGSQREASTAPH